MRIALEDSAVVPLAIKPPFDHCVGVHIETQAGRFLRDPLFEALPGCRVTYQRTKHLHPVEALDSPAKTEQRTKRRDFNQRDAATRRRALLGTVRHTEQPVHFPLTRHVSASRAFMRRTVSG